MKSVGEAMAIGRTFKQAFMKAMRSRELDAAVEPPDDTERAARPASSCLRTTATSCCSRRCGVALASRSCIARTSINPWFLRQFEELVGRGARPAAR